MTEQHESNSLIPVSEIENAKLEKLRANTASFQNWLRLNNDGSGFVLNGEPLGAKEIEGVIVGFEENWKRWPKEKGAKPEKAFSVARPDGDGWTQRCDLIMMTPQLGSVVLDLPISAYLNFGKYERDLRFYGKKLSQVITRAIITKGFNRKLGANYNTIRFEVSRAAVTGDAPKVAALPMDVEYNDAETDMAPPPDDGDFDPYEGGAAWSS